MLGIKELNRTLEKKTRIKIVSFETFKRLHKDNEKSEEADRAVAKIKNVQKCNKGYLITFDDDKTLALWYSGHVSKNGVKPKRLIDYYNGRTRINQFGGFQNSSMYPERLIGICDCILHDELPISFHGIVVNVMDGSGKDATAAWLGIPYDIHEYNLEWTLGDENWHKHGKAIKKLKEITGHCYRFSANDKALYEALQLKNNAWVKHYMMLHYPKVK